MAPPMRRPSRQTEEQIREADMHQLMALPSFRRFLLRVYTESGMESAAYGSEARNLYALEGRRSLGLDIFRWCDDETSQPTRTALQAALREDSQPPGETHARPAFSIDDEPDEPLDP